MSLRSDPTIISEKICIIGAGPTGLALLCALTKAAQTNPYLHFQVSLVEKRSLKAFNRRQKLIVYPHKLFSDEFKQPTWEDFCRSLFDPNHEWKLDERDNLIDQHGLIKELNKRQKLLRKFMRLPEDYEESNYKNASIKELQTALLEYLYEGLKTIPNLTVNWYDECMPQAIDTKNKIIYLINKAGQFQQLFFDDLVICDGEKREAVRLVNIDLDSNKRRGFNYKKFSVQPSKYHCAVRLKLKDLENIDDGKYPNYRALMAEMKREWGPKSKEQYFQHMQALGWYKKEYPELVLDNNIYFFRPYAEGRTPRFFMASEIPQALYQIANERLRQEKIIEWTIALTARLHHIPEHYLEVDQKGGMEKNATVFIVDLSYVDSPIRLLENDSFIATLGDSAMSPFYIRGNSASFALQQVVLLTDILQVDKKKRDFTRLERLYQEQKNNYQDSLEESYTVMNDVDNDKYLMAMTKEIIEASPLKMTELYESFFSLSSRLVKRSYFLDQDDDNLFYLFLKNPDGFLHHNEKGNDRLNCLYQMLVVEKLLKKEKDAIRIKYYTRERERLLAKWNNFYPSSLIRYIKEYNPQTLYSPPVLLDDVEYYAYAMFSQYLNQDSNSYLTFLVKAKDYPPALLELSHYHVAQGDYFKALICLLKVAELGIGAGFIELGNVLLRFRPLGLSLYQANWFFLKALKFPGNDVYYRTRREKLTKTASVLKQTLQEDQKSDNVFVKVNAKLDLLMSDELFLLLEKGKFDSDYKQKMQNVLYNLGYAFQHIQLLYRDEISFCKEVSQLLTSTLTKVPTNSASEFPKRLNELKASLEYDRPLSLTPK